MCIWYGTAQNVFYVRVYVCMCVYIMMYGTVCVFTTDTGVSLSCFLSHNAFSRAEQMIARPGSQPYRLL